MASYREPTFNLTCAIWRFASWGGSIPPPPHPDVVSSCQLRWQGNEQVGSSGSFGAGGMTLLLPKGTDVRPSGGFGSPTGEDDLVEVPAGTGRYYQCFAADDVARGFVNEHRFAVLSQLISPMPIP